MNFHWKDGCTMEENEKLPQEPVEPASPEPAPAAPPESISEAEPTPTPESPAAPPFIESADVFVPEEALAPEKTRAGRFKAFVRTALTWLLIFVVVFLAGAATLYFWQLRPTQDTLEQTQMELDHANQSIVDLQAELDQADFDMSYAAFLEVQADVYAARLALVDEDTLSAKAALANTQDFLEMILEDVAGFDQALADSLPQRLSLIVTNLDADVERAILDAELLSEDLIKVYKAIYAER
jgi:hypothetical protein